MKDIAVREYVASMIENAAGYLVVAFANSDEAAIVGDTFFDSDREKLTDSVRKAVESDIIPVGDDRHGEISRKCFACEVNSDIFAFLVQDDPNREQGYNMFFAEAF